ncbi:MAG TPA: hypothetical protein VLN56_06020 [Gammaproteobacteria bacterium]|nr:hypothetical protein [Gammaproteobacteria bacterium]
MKNRIVIGILVLVLVASLLPVMTRSWRCAVDARCLIVLAGSDERRITINPYVRNGLWISPDMAVSLLRNLEYPYENCIEYDNMPHNCSVPLVNWAGRTLGLSSKKADARMMEVLKILIDRGLPIDQMADGLAPVHEAILFYKPEYLRLLLEAGADLNQRVQRPGAGSDGLDAFQFYELVVSKRQQPMPDIKSLLEQYRIPNFE